MMMRCLIIDDEPLALELLEDNINKVGNMQLVGRCRTVTQAMAVLREHTVDLIFCDIQMPGINGLQFVRSLTQKPLIIFVTAYQEFAIDGFDLDVVDYLLKPVAFDRFLKACNKASGLFELLKNRADNIPERSKKYLFLHSDYNLVKISNHEITYIEGLKDYVKVHLAGSAKPVISRITIKALEEQLPGNDFFRIHKSYMVNLEHVHSIRKGRIKVADSEIPFSENFKDVITLMTGKLH